MQFTSPIPFTEALDKLGAKTVVTSGLDSMQWSAVPVALRERAFRSSTIESARFLQRGRDALTDFLAGARETLPNGEIALKTGSRSQFIRDMSAFAQSEGLGPLDPKLAGTLRDITSERRLGLIFDVQTRQAKDFGDWQQGQDPDVLNEFPAQRFIREKPVKEPRQQHSIFEDQVALKTDLRFWLRINQDFGVPWGPWGWGCGHGVSDIDRTEAESLGLIQPGQTLTPATKDFNDQLESSAQGLDDDMLKVLQQAFGDQVTITGDAIQWSGGAQPVSTVPSIPSVPLVPSPPVRQAPVSAAIKIEVGGILRNAVNSTLAAINGVHDDGQLPQIPIRPSNLKSRGYFLARESANGLTADHIGLKSKGPWPELTAAHEIGHFLDLAGIGSKGTFATSGPLFQDILAAANKSEAISGLKKLASTGNLSVRRHVENYLLDKREIWARAYAQFVTEKSGVKVLTVQLEKSLSSAPFLQWQTDDFKPIAAAIENLFKQLGWL